MRVTCLENGNLQVDDARIIYRNFRGEASQFNREGDRNFSLVIPDEETANALIEDGWNVKIKPPIEEGEEPFMRLPVKVKFNGRGPRIYLITGNSHNIITEDMIKMLDDIDIQSVNLDIRPFNWNVGGKTGKTAYLSAMEIVQNIDRFAARYAEEESPEE